MLAINLKSVRGLAMAAATVAMSLGVSAQAHAEKLNIAVSSSVAAYGSFWVALADNLFEKHGVELNIVSTNALSTGSAMLVSGQIDLLLSSSFLGMRIASQGKPLKLLYNFANMDARGNAFIGKPDIKSIEDLAAKGTDCRVLILPSGTATWAMYQGIASKYNIQCEVSTAGTVPLVVSGVVSGQFDAAEINTQEGITAEAEGKVNMLLDPRTMTDEESHAIYPYSHPILNLLGMGPDLEKKREDIARFIAALREASALMEQRSSDELGMVAEQLPDVFGTTTSEALAQQWALAMPFLPSGENAGMVSEDEWVALLTAGPKLWGMPEDLPKLPAVSYANVVDMSYYKDSANY